MKILNSHLSRIDKYLKFKDAEELIFNKLFNIKISTGGDNWIELCDKSLDANFYESFLQQLATHSNQIYNQFNPILATSIPFTNYRVQSMHSKIKVINSPEENVSTISIRIPSRKNYQLTDFIKTNNLAEEKESLREKIRKEKNIEKAINYILEGDFNLLISGGTSSGKTTLLNIMLKILHDIKPNKRVITIEDSKELEVQHNNKDQFLVSRTDASATKVNYIDMINSCMRLRPDIVLLGEVSIENSSTLLRIGNSGHKGMISTIHADTARDALDALAINLKLNGFNASDDSILKYISSAIDYVIQVNKINGVRQITEILDTKEAK